MSTHSNTSQTRTPLYRPRQQLRTRILLITLLLAAALLAMLAIYINSLSARIRSLENRQLTQLAYSVNERLETEAQKLRQGATILGSITYADAYLTSNDDSARYEYARILDEVILAADLDSAVQLIDLNGRTLSFQTENDSIVQTLIHQYNILDPKNISRGFTDPIYNTYTKTHYIVYYAPIFSSRTTTTFQSKLGTCIILHPIFSFGFDDFGDTQSTRQNPVQTHMYVETHDNIPVYTSTAFPPSARSELHQLLMEAHAAPERRGAARIHGIDYIAYAITNQTTGWQSIVMQPRTFLNANIQMATTFGLFIIALTLLGFAAMASYLIKNISRPLFRMTTHLASPPDIIMGTRLYMPSTTEIGSLASQINHMLDQIDTANRELIIEQSRVYEAQLTAQTAQMDALQKQMNPHLLFNTLTTIQGYAYEYNAVEIISITESIAALLHYNLRQEAFATLADELDSIKGYLIIFNWRFPGRIRFYDDIPGVYHKTPVPRFLLQPIVENAVAHGFESTGQKGEIHISATQISDTLAICIKNNGASIPEERLTELNHVLDTISNGPLDNFPTPYRNSAVKKVGHGLALTNVQTRIRIRYGKGWGLSVRSNDSETSVTIRLPVSPPPKSQRTDN